MQNECAETLPSPRLFHIGVVVKDIEKAVGHYELLGIGPFEERKGPAPTERTYFGQPAGEVHVRVTAAWMGSVQFELIQPVSGESIQGNYLAKHGEGINHLAFLVEDCQKVLNLLIKRGFHVIASGKLAGGGEFAYIDSDSIGGVVFELIQPPAAYEGKGTL